MCMGGECWLWLWIVEDVLMINFKFLKNIKDFFKSVGN
jgi:hypothetical protein